MTTTPTNPDDKSPRERSRQTCRAAYMSIINLHHQVALGDLCKAGDPTAAALIADRIMAATAGMEQLDGLRGDISIDGEPSRREMDLAIQLDDIAAAVRPALLADPDDPRRPIDLVRDLVLHCREAQGELEARDMADKIADEITFEHRKLVGVVPKHAGSQPACTGDVAPGAEAVDTRFVELFYISGPRIGLRFEGLPDVYVPDADAHRLALAVHTGGESQGDGHMDEHGGATCRAILREALQAPAMDTKADDARKIRGLGDALTRLGWDRVQDPAHFAQALLDDPALSRLLAARRGL